MSVARKKRPYEYPTHREATEQQEILRKVKIEAERLRDKLQESIIDNPRAAKKAALLVSLWIQGKDRSRAPRAGEASRAVQPGKKQK